MQLVGAALTAAILADSVPPPAAAPVVTAPPAAAAAPVPVPGWSATGEFSYTDVTGNTSVALLASGFTLKRVRDARYELELGGLVRYGEADGAATVENYSGSARVRFAPAGTVSPYISAGWQRDVVRGIRARFAAQAGAEANLVRAAKDRRLALGLALLRDVESRSLPPGSLEPETISRSRLSATFTLQVPLRDGVTFEHRMLMEPATGDFEDYLFLSRTAVRVGLTRVVALQTSFQFDRDNIPPPGVEFRDERTLSAGILLSVR
jgi:putative salt-induced outer membrane protein YdiY